MPIQAFVWFSGLNGLMRPRHVGLVSSVSASHAIDQVIHLYQRPSYKWYKLPPRKACNTLGYEFDSVARL